MAYYLRHYFDPDLKHEKLKPQYAKDSSVTFLYLGYVQNVVVGQVIAEVIDLDEHPDIDIADCDPRFISSKPYFPCGPNCAPHPSKPTRMIATANGYCFYHNGLITVKALLNIRSDVDLRTGNILFVGDVIAHQAVRAGFYLYGNNILVRGTVENAIVRAQHNIVCESGIRGNGAGILECGGNIKLPFCENISIHTGGNAEINETCLHSSLHIGGSLMVKGRLQGGDTYARRIVFVKNKIGGQDIKTNITLGFDPEKILLKTTLEDSLAKLLQMLEHLERIVEKHPEESEKYDLRLRLLRRKVKIKHGQLKAVTQELDEEATCAAAGCKLICPGTIEPSVKITIGKAELVIRDYYHGLEFKQENGEIVFNKLNKT